MRDWKQEAIELAENGDLSWRQIARELGQSKSTVSDFLRKHFKGYVRPSERVELVDEIESGAVIYAFDIETSPLKVYTWGLFKQNISLSQIVEDWYMLSWVAQRVEGNRGGEIVYDALSLYPEYTGGKNDSVERKLVESLWHILDEADIVVAHNAKRFDVKKTNAKFIEYGFKEPSPYKVVDTLLIAKAKFAFTSNKLDYITKLLEGKGKLPTDMSLWIDCMNGDKAAWERMIEYNKVDVTELVDIYLKLRSWDSRSPNMATFYDDDKKRCVACGSDDLVKEEMPARTGLSVFDCYRCQCCGKLSRDRKNKRSKENMRQTLTNIV